MKETPEPGWQRARSSPARDVDQHVAQRIRERRIVLGLTQQQVARRLGISYQQFHKYETGLNRLTAGLLKQIAHELSVDVAYFFAGAEEGEPVRHPGPQRRLVELTRSFAALRNEEHREAIITLARALAVQGAGAEEAA